MHYRANLADRSWGKSIVPIGVSVVYIGTIFFIVQHFSQNQFWALFPIYTISFLVYFFICFRSVLDIRWLVGLGVLARLLLVFLFPNLSDDIYRFFWDGSLTISGTNPYGLLPSSIDFNNYQFLNADLYSKLNSPNYYTIYPPINQVYFALAACGKNIYLSAVIIKLLIFLTEMIGLRYLILLLGKWNIDKRNACFYFLNPLVIIEGIGNVHFEVAMLALLSAGLYYFFERKMVLSAFFIALSIGVKLLPLMILPYLFFKLEKSEKIQFFGSITPILVIIFFPVLNGIAFGSFLTSVDLYFQKFEFNASIYYLLRFIGEQISGYNLIRYLGPLLALTTIGLNIYYALKKEAIDLQGFGIYGLLVWTIYLLLATTVHPWYVCSIVFLCTFTTFRYPILWSYLIYISYVNYSYEPYHENLWFIALEYILLFVFIIWERIRNYTLIQ